MVVMDRIVGGGAAARLFMNLREVHGYTYGAYSQLIARRYAGPWVAQGSMRTDATGGAMTEFMNEINRIRDKPFLKRSSRRTSAPSSRASRFRWNGPISCWITRLRSRSTTCRRLLGHTIRPRSWP